MLLEEPFTIKRDLTLVVSKVDMDRVHYEEYLNSDGNVLTSWRTSLTDFKEKVSSLAPPDLSKVKEGSPLYHAIYGHHQEFLGRE